MQLREKIGMVVFLFMLAVAIVTALCGCVETQKQLAQNLQKKSLMGDGLITVNEITVMSPETGTYTPEIKSIFISGSFISLLKDANFVSYDRKSSASTFNANAITTNERLVIQVSNKGNLAAVVERLGKLVGSEKKSADDSAKTAK